MRRYILTGTPGAGKTSILRGLQARGFEVVEEAATAVIAGLRALGVPEPWTDASFIDAIVARQRQLQVQLQLQQHQAETRAGIEVYDRSPVCTHALSVYLGYPISATLAAELGRIRRERVYERQVFFIRNIGFCEPTPARRISFEDSLEFERVHEDSYRELGFEIVDVPAAGLGERVSLVADRIARFAGRDPGHWT